MSRSINTWTEEYTGRHKAESEYSKHPVNRGTELPGQPSQFSIRLGCNWVNTHCATTSPPPARKQIASLWEVALFQSTNLACCVLQSLKLTQNPNKNMVGAELYAEDTVTWFLQICSLSKLAALFVLLPFLNAHH